LLQVGGNDLDMLLARHFAKQFSEKHKQVGGAALPLLPLAQPRAAPCRLLS
jgi:molecular chaperone DnaK (HSP70)